MSRVGKQPVVLPNGTTVEVTDGNVVVKGPNGELRRRFDERIHLEIKDGAAVLTPVKDTDALKILWGTYTSHVRNMVEGVNTPYTKKLLIEGVGYKANVQGTSLVMNLGFSHPVNLPIPPGISVVTDKESIVITGIDKEKVGLFASQIRAKKKPEPYKGKGIRYSDEVIRRKQGKKVAGTA